MNSNLLQNKAVLVTGGTGSFGHAITRRFLREGIGELRIFSRDEKKQDEMRQRFKDSRLRFFLGDVRDQRSVFDAVQGADLVFHAAALKQVPSCEFYPMEAVRTNVLGAFNVVTAAIERKVPRVIMLSTDKAVYPINAMGMTKALMEKLVIAQSRTAGSTVLCTTRYGNVMASRGSVIPLFVRQIREGRPLTVTDPSMTRFLMSLDDAVDLVLFAYEHAAQGDSFILKAPAGTMQDLAEAVQIVCGSNLPVEVIGTRHGEKLYETLVSREEMVRAVEVANCFRVPSDTRDLNYGKFVTDGEQTISTADDYTSHNTRRLTVDEIVATLRGLDYFRRPAGWDEGGVD